MGTLYVVATPIGNLEDVTLRALRTLGEVELVLAEDTRRTRILLDRHGVSARLQSLYARNESARIAGVLALLESGSDVALVSEAGTPLVSDPGVRLTAAAIDEGHRVESIPGPSAVIAAITVSGLPPQPFTFVGFLPRAAGRRRKLLAAYRTRPETLVVFESPKRVGATLRDLADSLGPERRACAARELTKLHEELVRGTLASLADHYADEPRGELTLVIEGCAPGEARRVEVASSETLEVRIAALLAAGRRPREIAAALAPTTGLPRRELYARAQSALDGARHEAAREARDDS